jgi:hypothetical protein
MATQGWTIGAGRVERLGICNEVRRQLALDIRRSYSTVRSSFGAGEKVVNQFI